MSYCVNCGVKLEASLVECPLCNTPVINPSELSVPLKNPPFPKETGHVDVVKSMDLAILLSVVLGATAISCGLLNFLVFKQGLWSLFMIGVCLLIWVFAIPAVIYTRISIYASLLFDGIAVGIYLFMISLNTANHLWLWNLALPITALFTVLAIVFAFLFRKISNSFVATSIYVFSELAILCVGIEVLIETFLNRPFFLTWSAVVLTACIIIDIALITILSKVRLRNAIRRRLHF